MISNMFKAPDAREEQKIREDAAESIRLTVDIAKQCLAMEQFKSYRTQYESAEQKMVAEMLMVTVTFNAGRMDLMQYGAKMLVCMTKLRDLRLLLDTVNSNAGRSEHA
jgi:hypothetical protein